LLGLLKTNRIIVSINAIVDRRSAQEKKEADSFINPKMFTSTDVERIDNITYQ
jgi:hypothetical protein